MSYKNLERTYNTLTEEQQSIVYNLALSLFNLNSKLRKNTSVQPKRKFGKYAGVAKATFKDNWEMSEEELCSL